MWPALVLLALVSWVIFSLVSGKPKNFWKQYGVRQAHHSTLLENISVFTGKKTLSDYDEVLYQKMGSEKFCGTVQLRSPFLFVKDLDIVKKILIKDFDHFVDRRAFGNPKSQPTVQKMLTNLTGEEWKGVRNAVSPTFTTGKIRRMMNCFNDVGNEWVHNFNDEIKRKGGNEMPFDVVRETRNFAVDVIANAVFGMGAGTIKNPNSVFSQMTDKLSKIDLIQTLKFGLAINFPKLIDLFGIRLINPEGLEFFEKILMQGLKARMSGTEKKNDFLQLMAEVRKGTLKAHGSDELDTFEKEALLNGGGDKKSTLNDDDVAMAQLIIFFFAGFSTTSNFIGFLLYVLALNPDCQEKLRKELATELFKDGNEVDYDVLNALPYLEMCVCEALRKFPPLGRLERKCTRDYADSEHDFKVPKDAYVVIPLQAIHNDKKYYEHPDKFYPEHFTPEKKAERSPYAYMPFGQGPRNCIGMRFALVEAKAAVAHLIHNFVVSPTTNTPTPIKTKAVGFGVQLPDDLELKLTPVGK